MIYSAGFRWFVPQVFGCQDACAQAYDTKNASYTTQKPSRRAGFFNPDTTAKLSPKYPRSVVSGRQRYKIWEQFTTTTHTSPRRPMLFQDDKDTKFESNSQPGAKRKRHHSGCFRTTKIQNLRAIHNPSDIGLTIKSVVSGRQRYKIWEQFTTWWGAVGHKRGLFQDDKDTKFESNSQLGPKKYRRRYVVSGRQRYKIWEQFTTKQRSAAK